MVDLVMEFEVFGYDFKVLIKWLVLLFSYGRLV